MKGNITEKKYIIRKKINNNNGKTISYNYYYVKDNKVKSKTSDNLPEKITNKDTLNKIKKIYIAPAYKNVKIFLNSNLLATGIDNAGRKQYIYSNLRKKKRETDKFNKITKLSRNIASLKKEIKKDLDEKLYTKTKILALILKIMDMCNFRCGNKKYEEKYGSYGLTTLHKKHFIIKKTEISIDFIGKKGVRNHCVIKDSNVQHMIKHVYSISTLDDPYFFNITDENTGEKVSISIGDVNKYLEKFNVTSKDLRTWNANIIFLTNFKKEITKLDNSYFSIKKTDTGRLNIRKKMIREAIKKTAEALHNTPAICKSSYIFKSIINNIEDGSINEFQDKSISSEKLLKNLMHI